MSSDIPTAVEKQLKVFEGIRLKPYRDTVGKLSIGVGRNLDDVGITQEEAEYLLRNDINRAIQDLEFLIPEIYKSISDNRKAVLVDMMFNLGAVKLLKFQRMLSALYSHDYVGASKEMLDSKWARQVKNRSVVLARMMEEDLPYEKASRLDDIFV